VEEHTAATLEQSYGDLAYLSLAPRAWFKAFLAISATLACSEPFLVAFPSTYEVQIAVLAVSFGLWVFGMLCVMCFVQPMEKEEVSIFTRFRSAFLGEVLLEVFAFAIGWGLIFTSPGMAALRIVRVYRFVWYTEFYKAKKGSPLFAFTFYSHLVLEYLESIGAEIFTLKSKGGPVIMGFFFFLAYTLGVAFWITTATLALPSPEGGPTCLSECDTLAHCVFLMMRLTFWDGSGFDFVKSLIDADLGWHAILAIIYMCISAFVLLNGLIAVFGAAFSKVADEVGEDDDEEGSKKGDEEKEGDKKSDEDAGNKKARKKSGDIEMSQISSGLNPEQLAVLMRMDQVTQDLARRMDAVQVLLQRAQAGAS